METFITFLVSVAAGVAANIIFCILQWLNGRKK